MKKKNLIIIVVILTALGIVNSCSDEFLEVTPNARLDQTVLLKEEGVDNLLIGAYSLLDGVTDQISDWDATTSNWIWGSVRGLEANKGSDAGDQPDFNPIQTFSETPTNPKLNNKWRTMYEGVSRCNAVIQMANLAKDAGNLHDTTHTRLVNQARVLRGFYHFEAWRMWRKIPYIDENTDPYTVTNTEDVRQKIIDDLAAGTQLPLNMNNQVGRWNKTVSQVMLAKAYMQMFNDYDAALTLLEEARTSGKKPNGQPIGLAPTYGEIFDIENRNGIEAVYTVQYSVNDGSGGENAGDGEVLNFPYKGNNGSPGGCCGFFQPTQEFVNSFRTQNGLPIPNYDYNKDPVVNDFGIPASNGWSADVEYAENAVVGIITDNHTHVFYTSLIEKNKGNNPATSPTAWKQTATWVEDQGPLDPRLDWSVGRKGIPYWDWGIVTGIDWVRDPNTSGVYSPKKQVYKKSQQGTWTEVGNWTSGWTSNGYRMIRYADILLLLAECHIYKSSPDLEAARAFINMVRERAARPSGFVTEDNSSTPAANYEISTYDAPFANLDEAKYALQMERKLELGQEGHRFFDLVRWGDDFAVQELNRALSYEKGMPWGATLYGSTIVEEIDVTYPIPQRQIDLSKGLIQQR